MPNEVLFLGIVKCPKCGTEGLLTEDGTVLSKEFYTEMRVCEVDKEAQKSEDPGE